MGSRNCLLWFRLGFDKTPTEEYPMSTDLDQATFSDFIANGLVLVDFWAPWCGPCRMQIPILEEVARQVPNVKIGKVNIDDNGELAVRFSVNTIPYLVIFKNGLKVADFVGMRQANILIDALQSVS